MYFIWGKINLKLPFFFRRTFYSMGFTILQIDKVFMSDISSHFVQKNNTKKPCCSLISPFLNRGRTFNLHVNLFCHKSVTPSIFSSFWKSISNVAFFFLWPFLPYALTLAYFWFSAWTCGKVSGEIPLSFFPVHKSCLDFLKALPIFLLLFIKAYSHFFLF